jgi:adenosylcobinamide-GDP ribazoletransferase
MVEFFLFWRSLGGAIVFYTCIPLPSGWTLEFRRIARWAPFVGLLIGGLLALGDAGLQRLDVPIFTRTALVVVAWIALTGGLHLDGAMDAADGLAVQNPERRLEVMADSATGAFGAMAAIALLLVKTAALTEMDNYRWLALMAACGWGRWGQVVAIALYPYLKPEGKGAFHKEAIRPLPDVMMGLLLMLSLSGWQIFLDIQHWKLSVLMTAGGWAIAMLTGAWFNHKLGGHTGDTYGAVVEWTEALLLCLLTTIY